MISTAIYFYAAYAVFWLLPTVFIIKAFNDVKNLNAKLNDVEMRIK